MASRGRYARRQSVYVHGGGGFELGAALHVRGSRVRAEGFEGAAFNSYTDLGNMVPALHDAIVQRWQSDNIRKAALSLAFVTLPMPPFAPGIPGFADAEKMRQEAQRRQCVMLANVTDRVKAVHALAGGNPRRLYVVATDWNSHTCRQLGLARANELVLELVWDHLQPAADPRERVRQMMVPVLSHVRWSGALDRSGRTPPWASRHERPVLMSYVGSALPSGHDNSDGIMPRARRKIVDLCASLANPYACQAMTYRPFGRFFPPDFWWQRQPPDPEDTGVSPESAAAPAHLTPGTRDLIGALELKRRSLFCMEPPGANPVRRSMYDSLLAGCIPVFIMSASEFGAFLPRPFFDRRHNMSVRIDPSELPTVDLHARLAEINRSGRALRMRRAIARHAHRLVYSLDAGYRGDASDAFVEALLARAEAADRLVLGERTSEHASGRYR